jgi:hypothetical protein
MPIKLTKLEIKEVSFVDKGDNKGACVAIYKRAPSASTKEADSMPALDEILAKLPEDERAIVVAAMAPRADDKKEGEGDPAPAPAPEAKAEDEEDKDETTKRYDEVVSVNKALAKRLEELETREKVAKKVEQVRKDCPNLPGMTPEKLAKTLISAESSLNKDEYAELEQSLFAASTVIGKSAAFVEVGVGGADGGSPEQKIEAIAKGLKKADPKLTIEKAKLQAAVENPQLYAEYAAAMRGRK